MKKFEKVGEDLYRLTVPFRDVYTTVYLLITEEGAVLFDTASYDEDVDEVILPALLELGVGGDRLRYIFISHDHRDHAGGLARLVAHYPEATVVSRSPKLREAYAGHPFLFPEEGELLLSSLRVVCIKGHTEDCAGLLDTRTNALLTGDCLQLFGLIGSGDWAANVTLPVEHLKALEKLEKMPLSAIYAAHDYYPHGFFAVGAENIAAYLAACRAALFEIKEMILAAAGEDDAAVRARYNARSGLPTVREAVVRAVREAAANGLL